MWNASTCVCVFHVTWCKMVKDIDNAQKVKSRVEREIWNSYTTSPTIPSFPWPGFHWVRIHREPSRVLRKSLVVSQRKRRGRDAERRSCQVFPARGSRAARRRGVPKTPAKAVLLNLLANSCTCFEYFQSVIYHVSKEKDQITFTHKRLRVVRNWNLFAAITSWERCWRLRKSEERAEWGPSIFHLCDLNFRNILGQRRLRRNKIFWLTSKTRRREGGNDARTSSVF